MKDPPVRGLVRGQRFGASRSAGAPVEGEFAEVFSMLERAAERSEVIEGEDGERGTRADFLCDLGFPTGSKAASLTAL